jgi:phosphate transport system substrate-binding protein
MKRIFCVEGFRSRSMRLVRGIGLFSLGLVVAGCPARKEAPEPPAARRTEGKVIIKGSNTIGEELAPRLIAEYKKEHSTADFQIEPKATMYGLAALRVGQCDIAAASREALKEELELAHGLGIELNEYIIGAYSVAVVVNAGNPVADLKREQVRDIFTGAIQNWKNVGGPDAPIHLYIRDPISGTYLGFQELAVENKPYASGSKMSTNYAGIVQAVAQDPNGIGYSSIALAKNAGVKAVSIGGVAPSAESVNKGQYPYARMLRLYTNKTKEPPTARDFIKFVQSPRGQEVLAQAGFVPRQ